ncbi:hypothetical protein AAGP56_19130, partial [Klebsiella pneumoniae]
MNKIGLLIVAGVLGLAGCSSTSPSQTVETINALTVPVSPSESGTTANHAQAVRRYFQDNTALLWSSFFGHADQMVGLCTGGQLGGRA